MPDDKKSSELATMAAVELLDGHFIDIYLPGEADPADQNQRAALSIFKTYLGLLLNKYDATVAPGSGDDSGVGYSIGSLWHDITAKKSWVCLKDTPAAAEWKDITADPGSEPPLIKTDAGGVPASDDDSDDGYEIGSLWIWPDETTPRAWVCVKASVNVAVWVEIGGIPTTDPINTWDAAAAPVATDDSDSGHSIGSQWFWPAPGRQWACKVSTVGAAVWVELTDQAAVIKNNFIAAIAPTTSDDDTEGYEPGSRWLIPDDDLLWICKVATAGNAVWLEIPLGGALQKNNMTGVAPPTINNDTSEGYTAGSVWRFGQRLWMCRDNSEGAAKWIEFAYRYLHYPVFWKASNVLNGAYGAFGRIPDDSFLIDVRPSFFAEGIASPDPWEVDLRIGGTNIVLEMISSNLSAWAVADLGKTILSPDLSAGAAVDLDFTVNAGDWKGMELFLKVAEPV